MDEIYRDIFKICKPLGSSCGVGDMGMAWRGVPKRKACDL